MRAKMISWPRIASGMKGAGGAGMTMAMADNASGAACAAAVKAVIASAVPGNTNSPPLKAGSSCA
ncbi:hypothetical protein D3C72_2410560 [compost metagenome]